MLYVDFESILKPVDEQYRDKINIRKAEKGQGIIYRKDKHTCTLRMVCTQCLCLWR